MAHFRPIILLVTALLLTACAASRSNLSYIESSVTADDAQTLARDIVDFLTDSLPPARTTIVLYPPNTKEKDTQDVLTAALLPALSDRGYGVMLIDSSADTADSTGIPLRYLVSSFNGGLLLRLQYQGNEVSRYYSKDSNAQLFSGVPYTVRGVEQ